MISTLLFDLGGTLHSVKRTDASCRRFSEHLIARLSQYGIDLHTTPEELTEIIHKNGEEYKHRGEKAYTELPQGEIWNDYYLKEFQIGRERLDPIAEELSFLYDYERVTNMRKPRLRETILELHDMGIRMGVISNIISTSLVPHMLNEYGISEYMECVVMSSSVGIRKPDPRIFDVALRQMGVSAEETGYVGDTISRDVLGARNAHLGLAVRINNPSIAHRDAAFQGPDAPREDYLIEELYELPDIMRRVNGTK
ncbi:MAG: HAD family hydrolase [Clostridia bacterium]|nr:HAD family hydrolase [Clostridia bacterium]